MEDFIIFKYNASYIIQNNVQVKHMYRILHKTYYFSSNALKMGIKLFLQRFQTQNSHYNEACDKIL